MEKFEEQIELMKSEMAKMDLAYEEDLLVKVAKDLGQTIYWEDASRVSTSSDSEIATVNKNYLQKKLGLDDAPENVEAIKEVGAMMGTSNKNKWRIIFYYLLCKKFGKESVYA
jgi:hypothetical protein